MKILGIETSCDETAAAVIEDGRHIVSNVVATQVDMHARYGGIVPEVASRQHMRAMIPVIDQALEDAGMELPELDGIAVTHGPGLAGALLVGVNTAKGMALAHDLPFIGVNHLEGHIYAAWLEEGVDPEAAPGFPIMCLITSGGHTDLILMEGHGRYTLIARTRDDAAGEAFDKAARVLGLGFPGGPEIQRVAESAIGAEARLPRPRIRNSLDFSFSGLKTATLRRAEQRGLYPPPAPDAPSPSTGEGRDGGENLAQTNLRDGSENPAPNAPSPSTGEGRDGGEIAAPTRAEQVSEVANAFQEAIVDSMVSRTLDAIERHRVKGILLGGGVAANSHLRAEMTRRSPVPVIVPRPGLCTDNGAMIGAAAHFVIADMEPSTRRQWALDVIPSLRLG